MSRVLIVEDEAHLAKGLQFNLEAEGHSVEVARDGERALQLLLGHDGKRENFDAVVLDIMLPGKDGFAVASELRAAKNFVPVLMLTARGRPEDVLNGFASGADDYLPKPFELPILLARLQGLLRRRDWMRESQASGSTSAAQSAASEAYDVFSPPSHPQQRPHRVPQIDSGRSLGLARRHRHARHRQFHRPLAALYRRQSCQAPPPSHRAGSGI